MLSHAIFFSFTHYHRFFKMPVNTRLVNSNWWRYKMHVYVSKVHYLYSCNPTSISFWWLSTSSALFPFYSFPPTLLSPLSPAGELSPALLHLGDMRGWMRELLGMVKAFPHLLFYWRCALTSVGWRSGFSGFRVAAGRESAGPVIRTLQSGSGSSSCAVPLQGLSHTPTPLTTQANTAI